jgi:hypothetical protein
MLSGIAVSLHYGLDFQALKKRAENHLGHFEDLDLYFDLVTAMGSKQAVAVLDCFARTKDGELELVKIPVYLSSEEAKRALKVLKKYPRWKGRVKTALNEVSEILD